jgi:methylmalonyl-CoA mutase, N-terminal domain
VAQIERIEALGGSVAAIEAGYMQGEIEEAAYRFQREIEEQKRIIVGVNRFIGESASVPIQAIDSEVDATRVAEVQAWRAARDQAAWATALANLREAARTTTNLFPLVMEAFRQAATIGEVCGVLRQEWGEFEA